MRSPRGYEKRESRKALVEFKKTAVNVLRVWSHKIQSSAGAEVRWKKVNQEGSHARGKRLISDWTAMAL